MSAGEQVDILNERGEVVGTMSREQAEEENHATPNVLIFLFNSLGQTWKQLRPMSKNHYPGRWDITACGGVVNGQDDSPLEAAVRETAEETGIDGIDLVFVEEFLNEFPGDNGENRRRWSSLFIGITDIKPVANGIEVVQFQSGYPYELREDATTNPDNYVPSFVFEIEKAERAYQNQTL